MGFENKHDPGQVQTRNLVEPKPNALLGLVRTRDLSVGNCGRNTQGVSPRFSLKSTNRNAAARPPSTTKYSQVFIGVPGGALDLGGVLTIGTSAMADGRVPRFAEIPGNPQFGAC